MFIGIFRIVADANGRATVRAVLLGLVVAALCTLKNTYIPPVMAIVFLSFLLGVKQFGWRAAWGGWAICSLVVGLCLVPWIIAQYGTCGTLLFPLLGRGYSVTAYGAAPSPSTFLTVRTGTTTVMLAVVCVFAALLVCAILPAAPPENGAIRRGALSLLLGSAMSVVVIGYASGGCDMWRYVMPFWFAACLVFGTILFRQAGTLPTAAWLLSLLGTLGGIYIGNFFFPAAIYYGPHWSLRLAWWALPIVFSLVFGWQVLRLLFFTRRARQHISSVPVVFVVCGVVGLAGVAFKSVTTGFKSAICVRDGLRGPAIAPVAQTQKLKALQASFPADEPVLVLVQDPFLLDFSKGRILLFDIPGGASLPPGIPLYRGSEPLAEYLLAQSIRYIAISYSDAVPHPPAGWSAANRHLRKPDRLGFSDSSMTWVDSQLQYRWDVQQNLLELCKTRKIIYRDGESCLLDLVQRR